MKIIGQTTIYSGNGHPYMNGYTVKIIAVHRDAFNPNVDSEESPIFRCDEELEQAGGVGKFDMIEVAPWIEQEQRFSWVTSDARINELECFSK